MCIDRSISNNYIPNRRERGVSLVELVMFIVIVSVAVLGILAVMNVTTRHSADPMVRKQALAVAESLMEEITLQPFTYCDPDDLVAPMATTNTECTTPQNLGPTGPMAATDPPNTAESRYNEPRFDNVGDYHEFAMNGIRKLDDNTQVGDLQGYNAAVTVTPDARGGITAADSLRIDVTVTGPGNETVTLTGYRFRYAPRAIP